MSYRDGLIWGGAIALSLLMHILLFVDSGTVAGVENPPKLNATRVSFRSVTAPSTPPQDEPQKEEFKKPEKEVVEAPEPPPKPKPKKELKRAEKVRQVEPPKPAPQPESARPPVPSTITAEKQAMQIEEVAGSVDDPALLEKAKHEYLRRLMAHIESKKHYPKVARRRGIEGAVEVSFRLFSGGDIADVKIARGHRILRKAVEEAIAAAQPMPTPPPTLELPMSISFSVKFSLQSG